MRTRDEIRAAAVPFPKDLVEQKPGHKAAYVSWYHYAQRLLAQVGAYSWSVIAIHSDADDGWICIGRLTLDEAEHYDGVGTDESYTDSKDTYHRGDPKAAESDAFKRACSKAGFGLHLWAGADYWLEAQLEKDTP